jgi:hypothetical protein
MRRTSSLPTRVSRPAPPPASTVLGAAHPLVRTLEAIAEVDRQSLAVAAVFVVGLVWTVSGDAWGAPVAASAALVLLVLAGKGAVLRQCRRDEVVALIAAGDGDVEIGVVESARERLLSARMRAYLAASLDSVVDEAARPRAGTAPLFNPAIVMAVAQELRELAELLREGRPDARGVALVWRLICDGVASPLHRGEEGELREELKRIRFVLIAAGGAVDEARPRG